MEWVSAGYLLFFVLIVGVERRRVRHQNKYDFLTLFWVLFVLQAIIPPLIVTAILGFHGNQADTDVGLYNRILHDLTPSVALGTLMLSVLFWIVVCASWFALKKAYIGRELSANYRFTQTLMPFRWITLMICGIVLMLYLVSILGGGLSGFERVVLLRIGALTDISGTAIHVFFGLTQAFAFIAVLGIVRYGARRDYLRMTACVVVALFFGAMAVSRREVLLQFVFLYFTYVLLVNRLRLTYLLIIGIMCVPILLYGKNALNFFSATGTFSISGVIAWAPQHDLYSSILQICSDIGRTVTDSWATLLYLNLPPRYGVDHMLSLVRMFNGNTVGLNLDLPERIVQISTVAFRQTTWVPGSDEPPGLMGQMWLDFRAFGPIIWGLTITFQLATLQRIYNRCRKTPEVVALYVILFYVVTLVINTGSFDFTFSYDWVVLVLLSLLVCRTRWLARGRQSAVPEVALVRQPSRKQ